MAGSNKNVGVIGLGIIGSRVAENLRKADYHVFVWNRTPKAAPNFLSSPAEVAEVADVIQIFVRDAKALLEVLQQMRPALRPRHLVLAHGTVSLEAIHQASDILADTGAFFVDAPFTGSKAAAQNGELVYYLAGEAHAVQAAEPILKASSKTILKFGRKVGDATVLKIVTNLMSAACVEALAEAYAITSKHGITGHSLLEAFKNNANCSPLITMKLPAMIAGNYETHFSLQNMLKDARYAQALAREQSVVTPVLDGAEKAMSEAVALGHGEADYAAVAENFGFNHPEPEKLSESTETSLIGLAFDTDSGSGAK